MGQKIPVPSEDLLVDVVPETDLVAAQIAQGLMKTVHLDGERHKALCDTKKVNNSTKYFNPPTQQTWGLEVNGLVVPSPAQDTQLTIAPDDMIGALHYCWCVCVSE